MRLGLCKIENVHHVEPVCFQVIEKSTRDDSATNCFRVRDDRRFDFVRKIDKEARPSP
jgi:hypothetical protein